MIMSIDSLITADALLDKHGCCWETVVQTFEERGMTEEDALLNARLARILQYTDYNFDTDEPILWTPTSSTGDDSGTTVQDETVAGSAA
ncbi:hypothetical protein EBT31_09700 [bacterium]|nr:hypothetical protein [bacterium]